jgi:hypothetical protein
MKTRGNRFWWSACGLVIALLLLLCGWLVPIHLRAVDTAVIQDAGRLPSASAPTMRLSGREARLLGSETEPATAFLIRRENRRNAVALLNASPSPAVQELLRCRDLTNTVLFPPSSSPAGQPFDAAVAICGLLLDGGQLTQGLEKAILTRATAAVQGGDPQPIEEILMDEMSLGQRLDWSHLLIFTSRIEDPHTLAVLAASVRNAGDHVPIIFSAVEMSGDPSKVARYLADFSQSGLPDLKTAERFGVGAVNELLRRDQRLYVSTLRQRVAQFAPFNIFFRASSEYALRNPAFALTLKWMFYLCGGIFIAMALQTGKAGSLGGKESRAGVLYAARVVLFALGVLLVAVLLSEPFLAEANQKGEAPFRLHLPSVGGAVASLGPHAKQTIMNTTNMTASLLTLLLFFILQAIIYTVCLSRLAETLRQNVPARVKLKLLENEDHLFDAGLYLGFVGTIICLILVSLGVIQFSLMAAYSSTSFGIIFVSILKIFNVRPARRQLVLQAEMENVAAETSGRTPAGTLATAP